MFFLLTYDSNIHVAFLSEDSTMDLLALMTSAITFTTMVGTPLNIILETMASPSTASSTAAHLFMVSLIIRTTAVLLESCLYQFSNLFNSIFMSDKFG